MPAQRGTSKFSNPNMCLTEESANNRNLLDNIHKSQKIPPPLPTNPTVQAPAYEQTLTSRLSGSSVRRRRQLRFAMTKYSAIPQMPTEPPQASAPTHPALPHSDSEPTPPAATTWANRNANPTADGDRCTPAQPIPFVSSGCTIYFRKQISYPTSPVCNK